MSKVTQVKLQTTKGEQMTTWLDSDKRLKLGTILELKQDPRVWEVIELYDTLDANKIDTHGWDNNDYTKHVGLFA
jgi:hypothetical protein